MTLAGTLWLAPAVLVPLAIAVLAFLPGMRARGLSLLPVAPLPALAAALFAPEGTTFEAPDVLLGARLALDGHARLFLGFAAFLWATAGIFARAYARLDRFAPFWCLTLAGNLGVFLAGDVVTFYAAFACVSLAAYPLIVHTRSKRAMRAGLVYIVFAVIGETCLLAGFMLGAAGAETLAIADVRAAIATSPWRGFALLLLVAGFGIKVGLVPLHVWLPLAHPAAPTSASAVLSGAIVKAGIFGLMQFLPFGIGLPEWQDALLAGGLITAFFGIGVGLTQENPKTILAYSTVSQMGLVVAVLGTALQAGSPEIALAAASLYALHHGLAKGALFLGVGIATASGTRAVMPTLALLAIPAVSLAGLPLTGGALAKLAAKPALGSGTAELLFTLSAVGTALLMLRFMQAIAATMDEDDEHARAPLGLMLAWLATVAAALVVPWLIFPTVTGQASSYPLAAGNLWTATWPVVAAGAIARLATMSRMRAPRIPEGDVLTPVTTLSGRIRGLAARIDQPSAPPLPKIGRNLAVDRWASASERFLSRWSVSGTLLLAFVLLTAL